MTTVQKVRLAAVGIAIAVLVVFFFSKPSKPVEPVSAPTAPKIGLAADYSMLGEVPTPAQLEGTWELDLDATEAAAVAQLSEEKRAGAHERFQNVPITRYTFGPGDRIVNSEVGQSTEEKGKYRVVGHDLEIVLDGQTQTRFMPAGIKDGKLRMGYSRFIQIYKKVK